MITLRLRISPKFRFFLCLFLLILNIALLTCSIYIYNNPIKIVETKILLKTNYISEKTEVDIEHEKIKAVKKAPKSTERLDIAGWIPDWGIYSGIKTLEEQYETFDSISPVYYFINPDGSLKHVVSDKNKEKINKSIKDKNILLIPTIQDFDSNNLGQMLETKEKIFIHNDQIIEQIKKYQFDGIDLDYESIKLADKDKFFFMLEDLSKKIKQINKKLVFTVLPKWGNEISYESLPQTRKVQDWKRISDLVDEMRIMTYELFGGNTIIGPIGPISWLELNIQYAIYIGVPREKIVLGVHTYSYDWTERDIVDKIDFKNFFHDPEKTKNLPIGVALFNTDIMKIKKNYKFTEIFNEEWGESIGRYTFRGVNRVVVFPTERSFEMRKELAAEYGIKGIAYWKIGDESGMKL
ncbi:hypothetical protein D6810_03095 [Candidatus Dojkabacteria bacterium]|uniref:GH18 domain-containing protein n=1 Tax=Candidatus Dojkabacteria bacterium TaxID=2099670 RepID=A0A3M0YXD1_9BACT|nr:MAG: hypothetical protein D6810_03095 [Candidatus Dojkabacteria bacterium]